MEGGRRLAIQRRNDTAGLNEVIIVGADEGRTVVRRPLGNGEKMWSVSSDGRVLLTLSDEQRTLTILQGWLFEQGLPVAEPMPGSTASLIDVLSGARLLTLEYPDLASHEFSPDGESLAVLDDGRLTIWDIPPPKSLTWFAVLAGILALPITFIARWRVRRLVRFAATSSN